MSAFSDLAEYNRHIHCFVSDVDTYTRLGPPAVQHILSVTRRIHPALDCILGQFIFLENVHNSATAKRATVRAE